MTEVSATPTEAEALLSVLERNRRTFAWKTSGLDEKGLGATTAASSMTLGGLVKHMALVEADWLAVKLAGERHGPPWDGVDFEAVPDWEWRTGATDAPGEAHTLWRAAVERSRLLVAAVTEERGLAGPGLLHLAGRSHAHRPRHAPRHDRGVRASHRARRPAPRGGGRAGRRGHAAGLHDLRRDPLTSR